MDNVFDCCSFVILARASETRGTRYGVRVCGLLHLVYARAGLRFSRVGSYISLYSV